MIVLLVYAGSLASYYLLSGPKRALGPPDLGYANDTIVQVTLQSIHTVDNSVDVKVLVIPDETLMDQRLRVLNTDISVRFDPPNTLGDLQFPKGQAPAEVTTTLVARGDADTWPFDSYSTDALGAELLVGSGDARQFVPARVEATGVLDGWNVSSVHSGPSSQTSGRGDFATVTLRRALGQLAFDLGICLVLITLPVLAMFVSIEMIREKEVPSAVFNVVRRDAVRDCSAAQYSAGNATVRRLDRPSRRVVGTDRVGRCNGDLLCCLVQAV